MQTSRKAMDDAVGINPSMDFVADWAKILRRRIIDAGYTVDPNASPDDISCQYFNILRRQIATRQRRVLISREFSCPPHRQRGFDMLKAKIERGDDLMPHQSRQLFQGNPGHDAMLNHWDIGHLHLGEQPSPKNPRIIEGHKEVLFARVTDEAVYCLDVGDHESWTEQRFVEILHNNWPESIAYMKLNGVTADAFSDEEVKTLRGKGLMTITRLPDGTAYVGDGYSVSGLNMRVRITSHRCFWQLRHFEKWIRENIDGILSDIRSKTGTDPGDTPRFVLNVEGDYVASALETRTQARFSLGRILE